ncbi:MAG: hypothetical protein OQK09_10755 [Colwellia sp.]|nr:hypothetical protein [Colwellia sp.]MCW8865132.1 hypothetical protein [Colwellia sp.]MCW9081979.1 hypothetical protein [Colwellia sp.]
MSKWIMTKFKTFTLAFTLTLAVSINFSAHTFNNQADLLKSCMAVESNLPTNHSRHPCSAAYMQNKSWLSWLSNDKKSAHLHFLDLVELLHYSVH